MNRELVRPYFPEEVARVEARQCPSCGTDTNNATFRDTHSAKEFTISGLCQGCQDLIFKGDD